ncbi:hypothetical protein HMPREF1869_01052 [Bacteroidales bacterium KA00251]|nr:hypothetical protein HMPREF1869_01052 [Bacteroidales bacterium KA00251]
MKSTLYNFKNRSALRASLVKNRQELLTLHRRKKEKLLKARMGLLLLMLRNRKLMVS